MLATTPFIPVIWQLTLFAFLMGCCIGSYLNVVIYRIPLGMKTSEPRRSFCPTCKYQIPFYQNIPIVSWLLLGGKCAGCRQKISPRYLVVEALTGILFVLVMWCVAGQRLEAGLQAAWGWPVLAGWVFTALCVSGSFIDIDHQILPHRITWGGTVAGLVAAACIPWRFQMPLWWDNVVRSLLSAAIGFALIWIIIQLGKLAFGKLKLAFDAPVEWGISQPEGAEEPVFTVQGEQEIWSNIFSRASDRLLIKANSAIVNDASFGEAQIKISAESLTVSPTSGEPRTFTMEEVQSMSGTCTAVEQPREAMGMGDANWMACVGAFLGWKAVLFTVFAGSIIGAVIALVMTLLKRREFAARIPFGPYLAAGALLYLCRGEAILAWYLNLRQPLE